MRRICLVLLPLVLFMSAGEGGARPQEGSPEQLYYRAFYLEAAERDFEKARAAYAEAAKAGRAAGRNDLLAKALAGEGRCLRVLGRASEAREAFERALGADPGCEEARAALEQVGKGEDPELEVRLRALVVKLGGAEREQAMKDLSLVGGRAIPFLARGLRSKEIGIVTGAAQVLFGMRNPAADGALVEALSDPETVFPAPIVMPPEHDPRLSPAIVAAALSRPEGEVRSRAVGRLGGDPADVVPLLRQALGDPERAVRLAALRNAQGWDLEMRRALAPDILRSLRSEDAGERRAALMALSGEVVRDGAAMLLADPDPEVVWNAAQCLSGNSAPWTDEVRRSVVAVIRRVVAGESPDRRGVLELAFAHGRGLQTAELLEVYAAAGAPSSVLTSQRRLEFRAQVVQRLLDGIPEAERAGFLAERLLDVPDGDGQARLTRKWVDAMVEAPRAYATGATSPHEDVRAAAYRGLLLGELAPWLEGRSLPRLAEDIRSADDDLREVALLVARRFPDPALAPALRTLHGSSSDGTRALALRALVAAAGKDALPEVRADLESKEPGMWRAALVETIALRGIDAVEDMVSLAVRRGDPLVPRDFGWHHLPGPLRERYVEKLPDALVRGPLVSSAANELSAGPRNRLILRALGVPRPDAREAAVKAALACNLQEARPELVRLLDDPAEGVRTAARDALVRFREIEELKVTFERFGEKGRAGAVEEALGLLGSEDAAKRRGGALALGALGDASAVPALLRLLGDPEAGVRDAALQALERLGGRPPR